MTWKKYNNRNRIKSLSQQMGEHASRIALERWNTPPDAIEEAQEAVDYSRMFMTTEDARKLAAAFPPWVKDKALRLDMLRK